ncbi:hypothetical protein INT43_004753 [Umbelopsis isabellina]|uniref:Exonuclease 1 n=1 Tax=Mortierella isabellina TaxID=91625 RepID=A0A8H7PE09_MORIS|nr:hypothetical protein INT43_004753 [Umbelopsis isabellina]
MVKSCPIVFVAMGISGLIPLLKSIHTKVHVKDYSGESIAVDGYVWLHRGVFTCSLELAMGKYTDRYVNYFMHYVRMLKFNGVDPIIVFDGGKLPSKRHTEDDRHARREEYRAKGMEYLRAGDRKKATECFQKCVDVTPEMAYQVIKQLKKEGINYIVAPYEADAQLAYLIKSGKVSAVITEDSDLIVFGCKKIIFKLDKFGQGIEINLDKLSSVHEINLKGWSQIDIRQMCILSGCDYLPSLSGMGLKTAHKLLQKHKTIEKVLQYIRFEGKTKVPTDYELDFNRAEFTFLYQMVYDMDSRTMVHLTSLPKELDAKEMVFLGEELDSETATKIAQGIVHPCTRQAIKDLASGSTSDNKENIPPGSSHHLNTANQKSIANYFASKPPGNIKHNRSLLSSKQDAQKPLVRRDSSFMRSVMDELSLSSQSSASSLASLPVSQKSNESSCSLKRPSPVASQTDDRINREDCIRPRVDSNGCGNDPPERLTLPHSNSAKLKSKEPIVISQVRSVRTVSRFFLSSSKTTTNQQVAISTENKPVSLNEKKDVATAAKENIPIDQMLASQKSIRPADKVLQGIKSKFSFQATTTHQSFLDEVNKATKVTRKPLQSVSSNRALSSPKQSTKAKPLSVSNTDVIAKPTSNTQTKQLNLLERYGYRATP